MCDAAAGIPSCRELIVPMLGIMPAKTNYQLLQHFGGKAGCQQTWVLTIFVGVMSGNIGRGLVVILRIINNCISQNTY